MGVMYGGNGRGVMAGGECPGGNVLLPYVL